jgi:hypothetical protein
VTPDTRHGGFRLLLLAGAIITIATGIAALVGQGVLRSALGLKGSGPGFVALARLYGGVTLAVGVGYLLAAIDPARQRALLVVLFIVPLSDLFVNIVGAATNEMSRPKGAAFGVLDLVYCLLFFRLYPKTRDERPPAPTP